MPKIHVLTEDVWNRIAAGEVVERPASVVRELLENAIDADAASITVEVKGGGVRLIRVSDDGAGMEREDALLSVQSHATSKLQSDRDLSSISTMGFRGEALPSIASVSRLSITTSERGQPEGVRVTVTGGAPPTVQAVASVGTTVEVADLFYNTPARRKFLKSESTEVGHIIDSFTRLALSHPALRMRLIVEGVETMDLPKAASLRERIAQIYGMEFVHDLVETEVARGGINVHAFVSKPSGLRDTRTNQYVFINHRPVRDPSVSHAVYSGYGPALPRDKHPVLFLFVDLPPERVDFNVHPAKREVRFADRESVYRAVRRTIEGTMSGVAAASPDAESGNASYGAASAVASFAVGEGVQATLSHSDFDLPPDLPALYLGDVFVAVTDGDGITIIDQHAAHERILYEKFLAGLALDSRQLLFPRQVQLSAREYVTLLANRQMLEGFGIEIEDFGTNTVIVRSLPAELDEAAIQGVLQDAVAEMERGERPGRSLTETVAAGLACHRSVRGGRRLDRASIGSLLAELRKTAHPDFCPHGRPTRIVYDIEALRKLFKRK